LKNRKNRLALGAPPSALSMTNSWLRAWSDLMQNPSNFDTGLIRTKFDGF